MFPTCRAAVAALVPWRDAVSSTLRRRAASPGARLPRPSVHGELAVLAKPEVAR